LSDRDAKMLERLEEKGKGWQVAAEKLVEDMAENSTVWRGLIRLAAMDKASTTMPSASMVTSLKPLLTSSHYFARLSFQQQLQVLEAFWRGLREVMRSAFDDPKDFVVQKGVGVIVLHAILVDVLEIIRRPARQPLSRRRIRRSYKRQSNSFKGKLRMVLALPWWGSISGVQLPRARQARTAQARGAVC
jgi:hypothetical protein